MAHVRCKSCGEEHEVPRRTASLRCAHCGARIDLDRWRKVWATEDLGARIRSDGDLPRTLQNQLLTAVDDRLRLMRIALDAGAVRRGKAEPVQPAPLQVRPPPLPPPLAEERAVAPAPSSVRPTEPVPEFAPAPADRKTRPAKERKAKAVRRGPTLWERLGPAFAENLGFGLAAFLILAGAIYFTTTAWTTMTGAQRLLVMVGGLELLGGVLFGAAHLLNRGGGLPDVERTLLLIVAFLMPIAAIPAGNLLPLSLPRALLAIAVVLLAGGWVTRRLARLLDPALSPFVPFAYVLLSALVLFGGPLGRWAPIVAVTLASLLLLLLTWIQARRVDPRVEARRWAGLWPGILFAVALAVFGVRVSLAVRATVTDGTLFSILGIVVAAVGAAAVFLEPALHRRRAFGRRRVLVLLVVAMALGITGTLMAVGDDVGLFVASVFGALACLRAGLALPVPLGVLPGLVLSALAYLKSSAPVKEAALRLRDQAAEALGYADRPMPLAWYGLTFLPYVFACAWAGWALLKREEPAKAKVFFVWAFLAAVGLSALALFASGDPPFSDLRAPAAVFVAQGGLLLGLGFALRNRIFAFAGALGILAGAACAVLYLKPSAALAVLELSALGLVGVVLATLLASRSIAASRAPVRAGILDASAVLALVLVVVAAADGLRLLPAPWWHGFGYVLLSVLFAVLAFAYRRPEGIALASIALAAAGARFVVGALPDAGGDVYLLVLALFSAVVLVTPKVDALLPESLRHPFPLSPGRIGSWTPLGSITIQLAGFLLLFAHLPDPVWTLTLAGGLLAASAVLAVSATREDQPWPLYPAVLELVAAGIVAGTALTTGPGQPFGAGGLAGAAVAIALTCVPLLIRHRRTVEGGIVPPLRHLMPLLVALFAVWAVNLAVLAWRGRGGGLDAWLLAAASLVVAFSVRLAFAATPRSHALRAAALYAGVLFAPAAAGLLSLLEDVAPHAWPLAFVGAAAATWSWAGRDRRLHPPILLHLVLALGSATWLSLQEGVGDAGWLLAAFALVAVGAWIASRRVPVFGWTLLLTALLLGISIPLGWRILDLDSGIQPTIWLLFAAAAYLSLRVRVLGVNAQAVHLIADPILALGVFVALHQAFQVIAYEPSIEPATAGLLPSVRWLRYAEGALGLAALARSVALPFPLLGRRTLALFIVGLAAFAFAPVNILIHGGDTQFWRPDVEWGLLALLLAFAMPMAEKPRSRDGTGRLGARVPWPILLALGGLGLTFAQLHDLSTPLTLLAATATLLVLLLRDRGALLAGFFGILVLATALAFATWWRPFSPVGDEGLLLLLGAVSALVAIPVGLLAKRLARVGGPAWRIRAGRELYPVGVLSAVLAFALVAMDLLRHAGLRATSLEVVMAATALLLPGAAAAWGALRIGRARLVHVVVLAGLLFYVFLVQRTDVLDLLDGFHLHALVVFGASLIFLSAFLPRAPGRLAVLDGLLLTLPAIFFFAPAALGLTGRQDAASSALALSAAALSAGAWRLSRPWLHGGAAVLINLVLFAFWRRHGFVDPAFYGIPPGLTLLGAAMLFRDRLRPGARLALIVPGLALVYGSVAIQVFRADDKVHALILFGLGLATVALGFVLKRNAWLVVGVVVIVLDVVAYLLGHGFESGFFGAGLLVTAGLVVLAVVARRKVSSK